MKLNLQLFADATYDASAVKGSRLFIGTALPLTVADEVLGVRETADKGAEPNMIDATTIKDVVGKNVDGVIGATTDTYTFSLDDYTIEAQTAFIGQEVYIYEEYVDSSQTPTLIGNGFVYRAKFSGIIPAGQSSDNLRTFTQTAIRLSDEYYRAEAAGEAGSQTFTYTGLSTGVVAADF